MSFDDIKHKGAVVALKEQLHRTIRNVVDARFLGFSAYHDYRTVKARASAAIADLKYAELLADEIDRMENGKCEEVTCQHSQ